VANRPFSSRFRDAHRETGSLAVTPLRRDEIEKKGKRKKKELEVWGREGVSPCLTRFRRAVITMRLQYISGSDVSPMRFVKFPTKLCVNISRFSTFRSGSAIRSSAYSHEIF